MTEDKKKSIVRTIEAQSMIWGVSTELTIQAGQNKVMAVVLKAYNQFKKLFSDEESSRFPPTRPWDHAIDFKPNTPDALPCKVYPMRQEEDKSLLKFLQEQEAKGYLQPSISPYASPFFFIQKKDGKLQSVQDYRCINDITISNQYPLPLISDLLTDLSRVSIFTKLDVQAITTSESKRGTNTKQPSKPNMACGNPLLCFLG
jgi:hypothetical protein